MTVYAKIPLEIATNRHWCEPRLVKETPYQQPILCIEGIEKYWDLEDSDCFTLFITDLTDSDDASYLVQLADEEEAEMCINVWHNLEWVEECVYVHLYKEIEKAIKKRGSSIVCLSLHLGQYDE